MPAGYSALRAVVIKMIRARVTRYIHDVDGAALRYAKTLLCVKRGARGAVCAAVAATPEVSKDACLPIIAARRLPAAQPRHAPPRHTLES